jgi:chromate transport protein ChrA
VNIRQAFGRGGFVAAACVACCAPPIIAALGLTAGLAATAGIFLGLAAAIAVVLIGGTWILARTRRHASTTECEPAGESVPVSAPTRHRVP